MIVHTQDFIPLMVTNFGVLRLSPNHETELWELIDVSRFVIMQFTNILDKNGKEIYEGDIIARKGVGINLVVKYVTEAKGYKLSIDNKDFNFIWQNDPEYEIVSNIFESSEFLK
jgi:hypothetical protein